MATMATKRQWVGAMFLFCLVFSGTLFLTNLGKRDLWSPDEPRYSQVAKEMALGHDYLVPRLNGRAYTQKPPFFFWLVAGSYKLFHRIDAFTARFPVALAAVLCVLMTFLIGKRLFGPWTGFFGALLLATASEFFWLANRVNLDTVMTLFILVSIYLIVRGLSEDRHRNLWFRLAFFFAGMGTITKGPLGFIVPFLTLIAYLVIKGDFRTLKKIPWISGIGILLLVIVAGLGPSCFFGGKAYTQELLFRQTLTRYLHGINHKKGFFYYFYTFPEALLPWVIFLPAAIVYGIRRNRSEETRSPFLFVAIWALANLLFVSFSKSKRQLYILSLLPAACLFVGAYIAAVYRGEAKPTPWFRIPVYALGIFAIVAGIAVPFAPYGIKMRFPDLTLPYLPFVLGGILLIVAGALLCFLNGAKKTKAVIWVMIFSFYALFFVGTGWILPQFNAVRSLRPVGEKIEALKKEGYDVRAFGGLESRGVLFYSELASIPVIPPAPWEMAFLKTSPKTVVVLGERSVADFATMARVPLEVVWKKRIGKRIYLFLKPKALQDTP